MDDSFEWDGVAGCSALRSEAASCSALLEAAAGRPALPELLEALHGNVEEVAISLSLIRNVDVGR